MVEMHNCERIVKFRTTNIQSALGYQQWYVRKYRRGLVLEISSIKKIYNWRDKSVIYSYE